MWCRILGGRFSVPAAGHWFCINRAYVCHFSKYKWRDAATAEVSIPAVRQRRVCACDSTAISIHRDAQLHLLRYADCPRSRVWKRMPTKGKCKVITVNVRLIRQLTYGLFMASFCRVIEKLFHGKNCLGKNTFFHLKKFRKQNNRCISSVLKLAEPFYY